MCLLNAREGMLSEAPLSWLIFRSGIYYDTISQLLSIMENGHQIICNAPRTKLWQIAKQLRLNPQAMTEFRDFPFDISNKQ